MPIPGLSGFMVGADARKPATRSFVHQDKVALGTGVLSYSFNVNLGASSPKRRIVAFVATSGDPTMTGVTLGGTPMTRWDAGEVSGDQHWRLGLYTLSLPSPVTSAVLTINVSAVVRSFAVRVYALTDAEFEAPAQFVKSFTINPSATLVVPFQGLILATEFWSTQSTGAPGATNWTNLVADGAQSDAMTLPNYISAASWEYPAGGSVAVAVGNPNAKYGTTIFASFS